MTGTRSLSRPSLPRGRRLRLFGACVALGSPFAVRAQVGDRGEIDRSAPPPHWKLPDGKLLTPEESVARFQLPPEFQIEVIAAEPLVQDPVAMQFDERGRLWVLEWPSYNWKLRDVIPGLEKRATPKSRLVIVEDTDKDGRMDRRTVFLDGIEWPRGFQVTRDGALVMSLPQILFARDTDGDGRADRQEVVLDGLEIPANPHNALNSLLRAIDNWTYMAKLPQRLRLVEGKWIAEPNVSPRGQWGLHQDNVGRLFCASNGDHLRGDLVPAHYYARNPNFDPVAGLDVKLPADQVTWPQGPTPGVNRRAHLRDEDGSLQVFTSNTGPCVYRGDQFPAEFVGNVFLGEVAGRFMRRSIVSERDGILSARNAYERREFLYAGDERFRPVYTTNGPDGALYVVDMHRGIIEGDIFVTSFLRNQIVSRNLQHPFSGLGRIYRISYRSRPAGHRPTIEREDARGWVEHLAHPNGFWRDTAQRLIVESGDKRVVPAVAAMAREHRDELARLHALWTLDGLAAAAPDLLRSALRDRSHHVRIAALRVTERMADPLRSTILAAAGDERIEVRRQVMFTLGTMPAAVADEPRLSLLRRDAADAIMVEAAVSGLHGREGEILVRLLGDSAWTKSGEPFGRALAALAQATMNGGDDAALNRVLQRLAELPDEANAARLGVLDGLKAARKRQLATVPEALASLEKSSHAETRTRAAALRKAWSEAPPPTRAGRALTGPVIERGKEVYALCGACHGPEGKGQPNIAPPLEGSAVVAGPPDELLRSILQGRNLDRANTAFPDMPPLAALPDSDIAAVASYVRARWSNATRAITIGQVAQARATMGSAAPAAAVAPTTKR